MSNNFETLYRVKNQDDLGNPEYWNKRWEDVDLRIHKTETQLIDLDAIGNRLEGIAIDRINNVITPLVVEAEERLRTVPTLFNTSSVTYNTIGLGAKYFTVLAADRNTLATGHFMTVYSTEAPEKWMAATVTSYDNLTGNLVLDVFDSNGTGSYSDWQLTAGGSRGATGSTGWSPNFSVVTDGVRRVLRVVGWIGGTGTPPATTGYLGASGIVALIGDAVDLRQPAGVTASVSVFTATAAQTSFAIDGGYASGYMTVYQNGVRLVDGVDVITTSGTNVVLTAGATAGDIIVADKISPVEVLGVPTKASQAEAWAGTENVKYSTPLRVAEYVARLFAVTALTFAQPLTVSTAGDAQFAVRSSGSVQSSLIQLVGRQASVDDEWNIVAAGSGLSSSMLRFVKGGWTSAPHMALNGSGGFAIGSAPYLNEASFLLYGSKNGTLYHDIQNPFVGSSAAVVSRWITQNVAGSGTTSTDVIKYRTGRFSINHNETHADANFAIAIGGTDRINIISSGNVGIGGIPESYVRFQVYQHQNAETIFKVYNSTIGASAASRIDLVTGTGNSYAITKVADNNGNPYYLQTVGNAVTTSYYDGFSHQFRKPDGTFKAGFDVNGFFNIGGWAGYPIYAAKTATFDNTMASLNNTGATLSKITFQDTSTTYNPGFGSNGNDLVGLILGAYRFRLSSTQLEIYGNISIPTNGYYTIAGSGILFQSGASYTILQAYLGSGCIQLGNNSDPQTYYNNESHIFRDKATTTSFGKWTVSGLVIGGLSINANAILDLQSTTKAFMPPRMTTTQKNAIASPTSGMMVYDSTLGKLCIYEASAWRTVTTT